MLGHISKIESCVGNSKEDSLVVGRIGYKSPSIKNYILKILYVGSQYLDHRWFRVIARWHKQLRNIHVEKKRGKRVLFHRIQRQHPLFICSPFVVSQSHTNIFSFAVTAFYHGACNPSWSSRCDLTAPFIHVSESWPSSQLPSVTDLPTG